MTTNLFRAYCRSMGLPEPVTEYRFGAIAMGLIILRCQPKDLIKAATVEMVKRAMGNRRLSYLELV